MGFKILGFRVVSRVPMESSAIKISSDGPVKVYKISIWLGQYLAATAKRVTLWSSTSKIGGFFCSKKFSFKEFRSQQRRRGVALKPTIKYRDASGKMRWKGTSDLTKTGTPCSNTNPHKVILWARATSYCI